MGPPTRRRSVTGRVGVAMAGASPEPFHYILPFLFGRGDFIGLARPGAFSGTFCVQEKAAQDTQTAAGQPRTAEEIARFGVPSNRSSSVVLSSGGRCELGGFAFQVGCYAATAPV